MLFPRSIVPSLGHDLDLVNSFDFDSALLGLKKPRSATMNFEVATSFLENDANAGIEPHMMEIFVSKTLLLN